MISKEIAEMINQQINAELWSAYLYLSMSLDAEDKNLPGIANWFRVQSQEEMSHSAILQNYMIAQEQKVRLMPIAIVPDTWNSPLSMFEKALQHEMAVTDMIRTIAKQAHKEQDFATQNRMQWFIDEQVEEENTATNLIHQFKQTSTSPCLLYQLDNELAKRKYAMPEHTRAENWL